MSKSTSTTTKNTRLQREIGKIQALVGVNHLPPKDAIKALHAAAAEVEKSIPPAKRKLVFALPPPRRLPPKPSKKKGIYR